jgi:hypothetical protein
VQVVSDEDTSQEGPIGFLVSFQEAIQAAGVVEPRKGAFHLPALAAVPFVMAIFGGAAQREGDMIFAVGSNRDNATGTELAAQRFAVIPFVQAQALGFAFALADANPIAGRQDGTLVMPIRFADGEVKRMPMSVYHEVPFEPYNPVFAGVADLGQGPFFDLMTLAS